MLKGLQRQHLIVGAALLLWFGLMSWLLHLPGNAADPQFVPPDAISYEQAGQALLKGETSPIRPWGYALLTAIGNGVSQGAVQPLLLILHLLCWLLTGLLLFSVSAQYLKGKWKYLPVLVFALSPSHIVFAWLTLTETVFTFLLILAAWLMFRYVQAPDKAGRLIWVNIVLAFACVVRPSLQLPVLVMLLWTAWELWHRTPRKPLVFLAAFVGVLLIIGFQANRMHRQYGQYTLSFIGKMAWYEYLGAGSKALAEQRDLRIVRHERDSTELAQFATFEGGAAYWKQRCDFYDADFKAQWQAHKPLIFKAWLINILQNTREPGAELSTLTAKGGAPGFNAIRLLAYKGSGYLNMAMNYLLMPVLLLLLTLRWWKEKRWLPAGQTLAAAFALLLALFLLLSSGASMWQGDRFSLVYYPLLLFAALLLFPRSAKTAA